VSAAAPSVKALLRLAPSIKALSRLAPSIKALLRLAPSIKALSRLAPSIKALLRLAPSIKALLRLAPSIKAPLRQTYNAEKATRVGGGTTSPPQHLSHHPLPDARVHTHTLRFCSTLVHHYFKLVVLKYCTMEPPHLHRPMRRAFALARLMLCATPPFPTPF
jgi:hypothetical protein